MILKTGKYFDYYLFKQNPKYRVISVIDKKDGELGRISFNHNRRKYTYNVFSDYKFKSAQLFEITNYLLELNSLVDRSIRKRTVGVISNGIDDFINWSIDMGHKKKKFHNTKRKYVCGNTTYICLSHPNHSRGYAFDKLTETKQAQLNKKYMRIVKLSVYGLKRRN